MLIHWVLKAIEILIVSILGGAALLVCYIAILESNKKTNTICIVCGKSFLQEERDPMMQDDRCDDCFEDVISRFDGIF